MLWFFEMSKDCWTQVSLLVFVGEVVVGDPGGGIVINVPNVFPIRWILALAPNINCIPRLGRTLLFLLNYVVHKVLGSLVINQIRRINIGLWKPTKDLKK
eukprot:TRINITY_DN4832_c0_g2_i3.p1 TRINITY_DN4832_c0_g2~~TRINITY_DN4832_c0_g2_i3.p1  ORF type:complete len:100 (+),score=1.39 TRINITY_DN4832_c0_g2_i3:1193-1492(+)